MFIVPDKEKLIRNHLQQREEPAFEELLALRPLVERVISGFAQCGGKQAHRMGHDNVSFDSTLSALPYNLRRLGPEVEEEREDLRNQAGGEEDGRRLQAADDPQPDAGLAVEEAIPVVRGQASALNSAWLAGHARGLFSEAGGSALLFVLYPVLSVDAWPRPGPIVAHRWHGLGN